MNIDSGSRKPWYPLPSAWRAHALSTPGTVLLETAGGLGSDHTSLLFTSPQTLLKARTEAELQALIETIEAASHQGLYAAGCLHYEAGDGLLDMPHTDAPLASFGLYREPLRFNHHTGQIEGQSVALVEVPPSLSAAPLLTSPSIQIDRETYADKVAAVHAFLAAGDTYQVNLTTKVEAELLGSPLALYETLIAAQPVDFAAIVNLSDQLILSFSPELFFRIEARTISTRPMKGTAPRSLDLAGDHAQQAWLANDEKNRAEHVMIVDLLRNDLGRVCTAGSVQTADLFRIETYPTLFQMTSRISGSLRPNARLLDILRALFPCGSITGAPKRRTMEIIRSLESHPRGVYTGAIGFLAPGGDACFSVPIRTLILNEKRVVMGVGGGIVADSTAAAEYEECLLKASFLQTATEAPELIETILWDGRCFPSLPLHIARLASSAAVLGFTCDTSRIDRALAEATASLQTPVRLRLLLSSSGTVTITTVKLDARGAPIKVRIAAQRLRSTDPWLHHKTTRRTLYDRELARARADGFDEVLFLNEHDQLAEGAISNLFVQIDGTLTTPAAACGVLPGILRQRLLETGDCIEAIITIADLAAAESIYLGNSLRGLRPVGRLHFE